MKLLAADDTRLMDIMTALSFQDLVAQRINKIITILDDVEHKLLQMVVVFGLKQENAPSVNGKADQMLKELEASETHYGEAIMSGAETYSRMEESGDVPTFRRASADKATGAACIVCHAGKQVGDVLGVLSVSIPTEHIKAASNESLQRTDGLDLSAHRVGDDGDDVFHAAMCGDPAAPGDDHHLP